MCHQLTTEPIFHFAPTPTVGRHAFVGAKVNLQKCDIFDLYPRPAPTSPPTQARWLVRHCATLKPLAIGSP
ncbi:unnamed protein product [Protopolystoma xenopodis]|uniref:Uncharacterized protein n=1 Tax=Protopolystoma xenopodis TaxID=117903 RepID=A0A3S5BA52_9PLAT|nr:unnamed protein product [Protopolystoma xenopodis]